MLGTSGVQMYLPHKLQVIEYEGLIQVKAHGNNILCILTGQFDCVLDFQIFPQGLLVVRQLNNQRYIESFLQPFGHNKRHQVPHMQGSGAGSSSRVQVEWFALLD